MDLNQLLTLQFIAHLLSDFIFQSENKANEKKDLSFKSNFLKWHVLITFVTSWLLSFQFAFMFAALVIALFHWLIDGFKKHLENHGTIGKYSFFIDQMLHFAIIASVVLLFNQITALNSIVDTLPGTRSLMIFAGYVVCTKPANIVIRQTFKIFDISCGIQGNEELPNAGKLIGITERFLVLTFIIISQFEAIGFLIAAKSILRFRDDNAIKSEYVLIGTMLSFAMAVAAGIIVNLS